MNEDRWNFLMTTQHNIGLTQDEMRDGWHFCPDFDYLLCQIGDTPVIKMCECKPWTDAEIATGTASSGA